MEEGKPENPDLKILVARLKTTTNSTHIWQWAGIKPGRVATLVGGELCILLPLDHPCSPVVRVMRAIKAAFSGPYASPCMERF